MISWIRDNNAYLRIPKNGISTFGTFLNKHGYREVNLFDIDVDFAKLNLWGHVTDPLVRHTKGVAEYLSLNPDVDYTDPVIGRMLVSGMFDSHTYTIHMMLGPLVKYPIKWIPLGEQIAKFNQYPIPSQVLNGDDLTNEYFQEQGLEFRVSESDHMNLANANDLRLRQEVDKLKNIYQEEYKQLVKNVLEADLLLYYKTLADYREKYSK
jgi:hypothetical protein